MLECARLAEIRDLLDSVPVCSSGNYVVCDGAGQIGDIELTPEGFAFVDDEGQGCIAHTNHFLCGAHACAANHEASVPDSFPRLERMRELLKPRLGRLTPPRKKNSESWGDSPPDSALLTGDPTGEPRR